MDRYENPEVSHAMNVASASPVREFFSLAAALAIGVVVFVVAVYLSMRWLLPLVPFSFEQKLAEPIASYLADDADNPKARYLQELADALAAHMELPEGMRITVHWSDSSTPNAFATLGGHITIFQGLLDMVESENALAMVMAHEIAHVQHRDPLVSAGSAMLVSLSLQAVLGSGSDSVVSKTSAAVSQLQFSRQQEHDADAAALDALKKHYGHTKGAEGFFQAMLGERPSFASHSPEFLNTHPDTAKRVARIAASAATSSPDDSLTPMPVFLTDDRSE